MVLKRTFGVDGRLIICTCDDLKGVDDHEFICTNGTDELRYKLFDRTCVVLVQV